MLTRLQCIIYIHIKILLRENYFFFYVDIYNPYDYVYELNERVLWENVFFRLDNNVSMSFQTKWQELSFIFFHTENKPKTHYSIASISLHLHYACVLYKYITIRANYLTIGNYDKVSTVHLPLIYKDGSVTACVLCER